MAQVISYQPPAVEALVDPRPAYVGCVVDTGAPRQVSLSISKFNGKPEFFVYRAFIANTEIIILLLFNIVPY